MTNTYLQTILLYCEYALFVVVLLVQVSNGFVSPAFNMDEEKKVWDFNILSKINNKWWPPPTRRKIPKYVGSCCLLTYFGVKNSKTN